MRCLQDQNISDIFAVLKAKAYSSSGKDSRFSVLQQGFDSLIGY